MSAETDFRACLVASSTLVALVGPRVVMNGITENSALPYVIFTSAHGLNPTLNDTLLPGADQVTITVECWAQGALAADAVADAVTLALGSAPSLACALVTGRASGFDQEQGLDATVLTVEWWH